MQVSNFREFEQAREKTESDFEKTVSGLKGIIADAVDLFFDASALTKRIARDTDDERYTIEVLAASFKATLGSLTLLRSGLSREAHMILRHSFELMLIAIDITYNNTSLTEWKRTVDDDLINSNYDNWYFKKSKICKRIEENKTDIYPEFERKLTLGVEGMDGYGICDEWNRISNQSLHAHSQAQIRQLFNDKGEFRLLGRKTKEHYEKDFIQYGRIVLGIVNLLIGIPKYRKMIGSNEDLKSEADRIVTAYKKVQERVEANDWSESK